MTLSIEALQRLQLEFEKQFHDIFFDGLNRLINASKHKAKALVHLEFVKR